MQGTVGLDTDAQGRGSLWFERSLAKSVGTPERVGEQVAVELGGMRVLLVDPASALRQSMAEMLEAWGAQVEQASNHDDALAKLRQAAQTKRPAQLAPIHNPPRW